ncbi:hypothetical protein V1264_005598 [Littorina saxatilis]|uniref:Uncharacterized protein n=1 Tax=Littorina saxatilis TaxID=31220 RepID=A0AAN9G6A2_9CAEN
MTVPQISPKDCQSDHARRSLTLAMIADQYPCESWIHVYTDGSATNGGAGVYRRDITFVVENDVKHQIKKESWRVCILS